MAPKIKVPRFLSNVNPKHIYLALLLIVYSVIGAWMFQALEGPNDKERIGEQYDGEMEHYNELNKQRQKIEEIVSTEKGGERYDAIRTYLDMTKPVPPTKNASRWSFLGSLFYAATIYTTIGYGNYAPVTFAGRCATILYASVGIPITLIVLNDWSFLLFNLCTFIWNYVVKAARYLNWKWFKGKLTCVNELRNIDAKQLDQDNDKQIDAENVPLSMAIFVFFFWVCACALITSIFQGWSYWKSFYFFFISLTTIGLGDIEVQDMRWAVLTLLFVLIGLSVVGMSIQVLQAKAEKAMEEIEDKLEQVYKDNIADADTENDEKANEENGAITKMPFKMAAKTIRAKDFVKSLKKDKPMSMKMAYNIIGDKKKKILEKKIERKARLYTISCQTDKMSTKERACQTDQEKHQSEDNDSLVLTPRVE